jgi:membrane-associated phospholipid phosphatase
VIAEHYYSPWVKIASWGMASAVGFARVNHNAHWTSDVLAGAAIGVFVGETVVRGHQRFSVSPMISPEMKRLQMSWSY